ncbi:MAG TPA: hypothetical protein VF544_12230 [Pyrinomonadaceae bacterium]|jgi:hypothetical protein
MPDYIPGSDSDFNTWQSNFMTYVGANLAALGLTAADLAPLTSGQSEWATSYAAHVAAQTAAEGAQQTKKQTRDLFETTLRSLVRRIQGQPTLTDAQRAEMGISLRETPRTETGVPTTRPIATVDTSQRLRHTINFTDETTPNSRAKPGGVMGCEIWVKVGDPAPTDPDQLQFLGTDTRTPYIATYGGEEAGKVAHYMLRWVNTKGEQGPWSQTVSATITG